MQIFGYLFLTNIQAAKKNRLEIRKVLGPNPHASRLQLHLTVKLCQTAIYSGIMVQFPLFNRRLPE